MTAIEARRGAVLEVLGSQPGWSSAQDLHAELRRRGQSLGLTTVYRHLQTLADTGHVDSRRTEDGETVYRRCATDLHHHHLTCRICGSTVELQGPPVEAWAAQVARENGFSEVSHTVEVTGICARCFRR